MSALARQAMRQRVRMRRLRHDLQHLSLEKDPAIPRDPSDPSDPSDASDASDPLDPAPCGAPSRRRRCIFYDLETSIVSGRGRTPLGLPFTVPSSVPCDQPIAFNFRRGMRRNLIVEIGAVDMGRCGTRQAFHRFVDPRLDHLTLSETFAVTGQSVTATLRFWEKLFQEKRMLGSLHRDASVAERLRALDALFDQSQFLPAKTAMSHFIAYVMGPDGASANPFLVAHNGASFDAPILRAHLHRLGLPQFDRDWMKDSIPAARRAVPRLKSYALGKLHKRLVGVPFQAHHASSDALALLRVCQVIANIEGVELYRLWCEKNPPLTAVKGIGPKTSKRLRERGVEDVDSLAKLVRGHAECPLQCLRHAWKSLRRKYRRDARRNARRATGRAVSSPLRSKSV